MVAQHHTPLCIEFLDTLDNVENGRSSLRLGKVRIKIKFD